MWDQYRVLSEIANWVNSKGAFGNGLCIASDPISRARRKLNVFYWNLWEIQAYLLLLIEIMKSEREKHSLTKVQVSTVDINVYMLQHLDK